MGFLDLVRRAYLHGRVDAYCRAKFSPIPELAPVITITGTKASEAVAQVR